MVIVKTGRVVFRKSRVREIIPKLGRDTKQRREGRAVKIKRTGKFLELVDHGTRTLGNEPVPVLETDWWMMEMAFPCAPLVT